MATDRNRIDPEPARHSQETGQASILVLLMLSLFLLAVLAFAVDYTNIWFHRQRLQTAADAACQAGVMDVYQIAAGATLPNMGFAVGAAGNCNIYGSNGPTMCWYAGKNGFNGYSGGGASVSWTFPSTVSGVTPPPSSVSPYPFMQVTVLYPVKTYFSTLLTGNQTQQVGAIATCGLTSLMEGDVILALNPTASGSYTESGTGTSVKVLGGTARGIQVNSNSSSAVVMNGGSTVDLSKGGANYTGSDFGVTGGPSTNSSYTGGSTGSWRPLDTPLINPYQSTPAPASVKLISPLNGTNGKSVPYRTDGCPDPASSCVEFWPGYYGSGISLTAGKTAIFNPGIYYMDGSLNVSGGSTLRMARAAGQLPTDGMMFYFHSGTVKFTGSGSGSSSLDPVPSNNLTCDGSTPNSSLGIPSMLTGHVLWAQCTNLGTYWDTGHDTNDSVGSQRGLLFFQDPSDTSNSPSLAGGSGIALAGNMYFHSSTFSNNLTITGGSGVFAATWGSIVTDMMTITGGSTVNMLLNPADSLPMTKVALLQ